MSFPAIRLYLFAVVRHFHFFVGSARFCLYHAAFYWKFLLKEAVSCLKTREMPFQRPEISQFPGGACPRTPLGARAYGARRLAPSTLDHTRHQPPPLQNSWIRPCCGLSNFGNFLVRFYTRVLIVAKWLLFEMINWTRAGSRHWPENADGSTKLRHV